jgi:hypothetical protein
MLKSICCISALSFCAVASWLVAAEGDAAKTAPAAKKPSAEKPPVVVEDPTTIAVPEWKPKLDLTKLPGIVVDNNDAELSGDWVESNHVSPYIGENYVHDGNMDKGERLAKYTPDIPKAGRYAIRVSYTLGKTRAANVPITIDRGTQQVTVYLDQRTFARKEIGPFAELGIFELPAGKETSVTISNSDTKGYVIADAVWFEKVSAAVTPVEKLATKPLTEEQIAANLPPDPPLTAPQKANAAKGAKKNDPKKPAKEAPVEPVKKPTPPAGERFVWLDKPTPKLKKLDADKLDALIESQLAGMTLAENVSDEHFLRRVSLDLCGRPPSTEEYEAFMADNNADKRSRAVDRLLAHEDFGRNWGNYWSDTMSARIQPPELTFLTYKPFKTWLAKELNADKSWANIVTQIFTAEGILEEKPETTYIAYHQGNPISLAGESARIFLGAQIGCAQCHDHPFDRWKQVEFHQTAAFFVRSSVKMPQNSSLKTALTSKETGEHKMPEKLGTAHPVVLTGEALAREATDPERRAAFAAWLTHAENPWFAKTYVNRIWSRMMGHGFVEPVDNLGVQAEQHFPEAHEALAEHFAATGYDIKDLFRIIIASEAYQRQLPSSPEARKKLFAAARTAKLRGDEVYDSLAAATGLPDVAGEQRKATTAERFPPPPKSTRDRVNEVFGFDPSLAPADVSRTMPQALYLMNNEALRKQIDARPDSSTPLAKLLAEEKDNGKAVTQLYHRVLAREPSEAELRLVLKHLDGAESRVAGFEDLLWSLVNSTEFTTKR